MIDRKQLLKDLQRELPKIEKDILAYSESKAELTDHLQEEYEKTRDAGRTAGNFLDWRAAQITQAAAAWVLTCVFVRFMEDNQLLAEPMLAGPVQAADGSNALQHAKERMAAYFNDNPTHAEREYLLSLFEQLEQFPVIAELIDHQHNPLWHNPVSADGAKALIDFFQKIDPASGETVHDFTDPEWDTRFLGDLYQDLSESVRKRYALLQTPEFVESFILDYTLEKAKDTFGLPGLRLIDPTCGSGHFLLTTFERVFDDWVKREPATNTRELAQRALDVVHGVDINPYAVSICRFRLLIAAMKESGTKRIKDAPDFHFHLACGDSLLHGRRFEWQGQGQQTDLIDDDPIKHVLEVEDKDKLGKILGQQYHVVVGNPPYIVVRDKALNKAYRNRYPTCHRQYSLGVPFTERFFDLTLTASESKPAGYLGMITANSFMKREFGIKLIENFLVHKNTTYIVDASGAYVPGHGTPTVIIFARNEEPQGLTVRAALGKRAEPSTPNNPEHGKVWNSIVSNLDNAGVENEFISITDRDRAILAKHPWSLKGGGASEVKILIENNYSMLLSDVTTDIGRTTHSGEDSIFYLPKNAIKTLKLDDYSVPLMTGEVIRDWTKKPRLFCVFPYEKASGNPLCRLPPALRKYLWEFRTTLKQRMDFGKFIEERGLRWYEHSMFFPKRYCRSHSLPFAFVASHNHFVVDRGGSIYKQSAPVIGLREDRKHLSIPVIAFLNSSLACFWMKQVSHQKQLTGGDGVRVEFISKVPYEFTGTQIMPMPLPNLLDKKVINRLSKLGEKADDISLTLEENEIESLLAEALKTDCDILEYVEKETKIKNALRNKLVLIQEEMDWTTYWAFGFCDEGLLADIDFWMDVDLAAGQRPFEILAQLNQDGFDVPEDVPSHWPEKMQLKWRQRMEAIKAIREIQAIEDPHYKRRWIGRQGLFNKTARADELKVACKQWMLDRLENQHVKTGGIITTCAALADQIRSDNHFHRVATHYAGSDLHDIQRLVSELVVVECLPQVAAARLKPNAMPKFRAWQETWSKQRQEDAIDAEFNVAQPLSEKDAEVPEKVIQFAKAKQQANAKKTEVVGNIPVPPKYAAGDFRKPSYWKLRGKLDVPKERFFSLPGCEKDGDATLVIGWAGMDHLKRAGAIADWYMQRKENDGWEAEKLKPMLVALDELIPWLKQWHNDIDPEYDGRMGDFYEGFLLEELRLLDISRDELLSWEPPAAAKKSRARKPTKAATAGQSKQG